MDRADRNRKLRAAYTAMGALSGGLLACLVTLARVTDSGATVAGLFVTFAGGVGAALALFINGNVRTHAIEKAGPP